jgi:serine/threonine protein kinase
MPTALLPSSNLAGTRVGAWNIERAIGAGGMGSVWKGIHAETYRPAAIKVILIEQLADERVVKRFEREKRVVVEHDHLVQVLDAGRLEDGRLFLALEYLEGADLEAFCRSQGSPGKLSAEHALHVAVQIADGLEALHRAGFIHRDIKPPNVFLTRGAKQHVKLIDYGLAKPLDGSREELLPGMTQERIGAGTPDYMAPEQFTDFATVDARADVYSLAMVMFRMVTGRTAYLSDRWQEQMTMRFEQQFEPRKVLEHEAPHVSVACYDALMRGLAYQKEARWHRPRELVLAFADGIENGRRRVYAIAPDFDEHAAPTDETVKHSEKTIPPRMLVGTPPPAAPPLTSVGPSSMNGERERPRAIVRAGRSRLLAFGLVAAAAAAAGIVLIAHNAHESSTATAPTSPTKSAPATSSAPTSPTSSALAARSAPATTAPTSPTDTAATTPSLRKVRIITNPPGATIAIDGAEFGPAPVTAALPDGARVVVRAQLDGYDPGQREIAINADLGDVAIDLPRKASTSPTTTPPPRTPPRSTTRPTGTTHSGDTRHAARPTVDLDHPLGPQ